MDEQPQPQFDIGPYVGALLALGVTGVVCYIAVTTLNEIALGALIGIVAASGSYFLRGKIEAQSNPAPLPPPPPGTVRRIVNVPADDAMPRA